MKNRSTTALFIISIFFCASTDLIAQSDRPGNPDIRWRLLQIERGEGESVRAELAKLLTSYQNHPGVLYLQGVLTTDGAEAVKTFQSVVDNFPTNEWSDDALYRLYQYYYSIGLYRTADQKLDQLKREYPLSAYVTLGGSASEQSVQKEERQDEGTQQIRMDKSLATYTVQVGAFSTIQNAEQLKKRFEREKYICSIFTAVKDGKRLYKVWVGEFNTQEKAKKFALEIKRKFNLESMVISR